nr:ribonuclease H-like domain-containing protein [Tanacetum cinerariifolium]
MDLKNMVINDEMINYVLEKCENKWQDDNGNEPFERLVYKKEHFSVILPIILLMAYVLSFAIFVDDKRKLTGIKIVDDLEKRIQNIEIELNKAKENMLKERGFYCAKYVRLRFVSAKHVPAQHVPAQHVPATLERTFIPATLPQIQPYCFVWLTLLLDQLSVVEVTTGYGDQLSKSNSEVFPSVFDSRSSDGDDNPTNDRPTSNKASASISKGELNVSDDEDTLVDTQVDSKTTIKPSFKKIEFIKARNESVKSYKQADKPKMVTQNSRADRKDWNGNLTQKPRISKETVNTVRINGVNIAGQTSVSIVEGNRVTAVKTSAGNKSLLTDYQDIDGGLFAFGGSTKGATIDESNIWHRRMGHVNFKTINKLVKGNLVRGLPSKTFKNDHTYVACQKGKQHKASCKAKLVRSISQPLQVLHMDLFGPTSKSSDEKAGDDTADDAAGKEKVQEPVNDVKKEFQAQCNSQLLQENVTRSSNTNIITTVSTPVNTASASRTFILPHDPPMPELEDTVEIQTIGIFGNAYDEDDLETNNQSYADESVGAEADFNNMEPSTVISPIPTTRVETMQEELLQFKIQKVWTLVDLPYGKKAIGTKWVYQNKKDEREIVVRNKAIRVAQGHTQEEGIDYDEVFALVARVEAISLCRPMRLEENDMWVWGQGHMGRSGEGLGTVQVRWGCTGMAGEEVAVLAGKGVKEVLCELLGFKRLADLVPGMLDYGYNFMQTKIHVDNESAICVIKNHVYHSKTKHIKNWHHFIRDSYKKRLIKMVKIHTENNVSDLLTKAFDVNIFNFLVASIVKIYTVKKQIDCLHGFRLPHKAIWLDLRPKTQFLTRGGLLVRTRRVNDLALAHTSLELDLNLVRIFGVWGGKGRREFGKECATWDEGKGTCGGRAKGFGTVPVCVSVQEMAGGEGRVLARMVVKGALFR